MRGERRQTNGEQDERIAALVARARAAGERLPGPVRGTIITGEERLRVVRGEVSAAGARVNGGGFTSVRTAVGTYTVTFADPFTAVGTLLLSTAAGGSNITANAVGAFSVFTFNTATGGALDTGWHFLAIGLG